MISEWVVILSWLAITFLLGWMVYTMGQINQNLEKLNENIEQPPSVEIEVGGYSVFQLVKGKPLWESKAFQKSSGQI